LIQLAGSKVLVPTTEPIVEDRIVRSAGLAAVLPGKLACSTATLTFSNQSAPIDSFIASAPQPGFTTTYGFDTVFSPRYPITLFAGFSRTSLPSLTNQFILRARFGYPFEAFENVTVAACNGRKAGS